MLLFRAMKETPEGLPETGPSARKLGARPSGSSTTNPDVLASSPDDLVSPGGGGMSVAPDNPFYLQRHRRPASLGGIGLDPVWKIESDDLGRDLQSHQDSATHGVIEPKRIMTLWEFQEALARTRDKWRLHCR
jgi:hypothetical protein